MISANLWYIFLVCCSVISGRPLKDGEALWDRDGVDIDRYTFSESDAEACKILQIHGCQLFYVRSAVS